MLSRLTGDDVARIALIEGSRRWHACCVAEEGDAPSVRRATDDDAFVITDLWLRSRRAALPSIPAPLRSDEEVRAWFASIVIPTRETWVVEESGKITGLLVMDEGWIDQLYVDPSLVGKGLGSCLSISQKPRARAAWTSGRFSRTSPLDVSMSAMASSPSR
jgi:hypothetical protein